MRTLSLLMLVWAGAALATPQTFQLGSYRIITEANGDSFRASYTPFEKYQHEAWFERRYHPIGDPTGPRPYWNLPPAKPLPRWQNDPDLTRGPYTLELSTQSIRGWHRLELADEMVSHYLIAGPLRAFLVEHESELRALLQGLPRTILFADYGRATVAQQDQFLLSEALASLKHRSIHFGSASLPAGEVPPRIPKLGDALFPITEPALIVVHATTVFDEEQAAQAALDPLIAKFKAAKQPVIYLMTDSGEGDQGWYTADREPTLALFSAGGEHNLPLETNEVTVAGGFFGDYDMAAGCQYKAMADAITRHFVRNLNPFTVHLPLRAIYFYEDDRPGVEAFLTGEKTPAQFVKWVEEALLFTDDPSHLGMDTFETGVLSTRDYTFRFTVGGKTIDTRGNGPRQVELSFE